MRNGQGYRRANRWLAIGLTGVLMAACSGGVPSAKPRAEESQPSGTQVEPAPQPTPAPETPSPLPDVEHRGVDPSKPGPLFVSARVAERIGSHLEMGSGLEPEVGDWAVFLYMRDDRVGVGIRIGHQPPALGCCLRELHSAMRPLAFVQVSRGTGFVVSYIDARVEGVRFDCAQCPDLSSHRVHVTHIVNGRIMGVPQLAVAFVRPNASGGNDGTLIALGTAGERIARRWIGLPPACSAPSCPNGLSWGLLTPGTERW